MKRFLLFGCYAYEGLRAWDDFKGEFDWLDEALSKVDDDAPEYGWWNIVDTETMKIVKEG